MKIGIFPVRAKQKTKDIANYSMKPQIKIFKSANELAESLAIEFQKKVNDFAANEQAMFIAISGGSTPQQFFKALVERDMNDHICWKYVQFFWGDERCVPPEDAESNYGMTEKTLLNQTNIPERNIYRIKGENDPETEATRYHRLVDRIAPKNRDEVPQFDWIFLGMGEDGHTASIFPNSKNEFNNQNITTVTQHPLTGQKRISLTLKTINQAKRVSFLVTGKRKRELVNKILISKKEINALPAACVNPKSGILDWYVDEAAGSELKAFI